NDLVAALECDGNGEHGDAVEEVGRAVERIDDPTMLAIRAGDLAALLHQEGVRWASLAQFVEDDLLGAAIGVGHKVGRALARNLEVLDLAEIAGQRAAGLEGGLNHDVEERRAGHWKLEHRGRAALCPRMARRSSAGLTREGARVAYGVRVVWGT